MKKTRKTCTINILKKSVMLMLSAVLLTAALPVTTTEAKKLGKVPMGHAVEHPRRWLGSEDENTIDFPHCLDDWGIDRDLNCKPGDTFTFTVEWEKFEAKNNYNFKIYGDIIWCSSDTDVATVNKKGKVTVKSEGNAAITASIRYKGTNIYGTHSDSEVVVYRHWIHSGPVLQLKKTNVKAVARNAYAIIVRDRTPIVRAKGSPEETKELFESFVKEYNKHGRNATCDHLYKIGNFTYWW